MQGTRLKTNIWMPVIFSPSGDAVYFLSSKRMPEDSSERPLHKNLFQMFNGLFRLWCIGGQNCFVFFFLIYFSLEWDHVKNAKVWDWVASDSQTSQNYPFRKRHCSCYHVSMIALCLLTACWILCGFVLIFSLSQLFNLAEGDHSLL